MTNAELIAALRYCGGEEKYCKLCPSYDTCHAEVGGVKQILLAAADALGTAEKRIAELSLDNKMLKNTIDADKGVMLDRIRFLEAQLPKEGEWVGRQKHRRCSICGFSTWYDFALDCELTSPFCPECGARMKGEQE